MQIQRWQTVFLLIAAVMMGLFTFVSLGQVQLEDYTLNFTTIGFSYEGEATEGAPTGYYAHTWGLFVLSVLSIAVPFVAIFLYGRLNVQKLLCGFEILLLVAITAVGGYIGAYWIEGGTTGWSSVIIAPLIAFVATVLALRLIRKDDRTLKSLDRLR